MKQTLDSATNWPDVPVIESHPFQPYLPKDAKVLIMGTFPPKSNRWAMDFYYPNRINDFWRIMGLIFFHNENRFYDPVAKSFLLDDIKTFLEERGIALSDTGAKVRRHRDNASDKYLEIVEPVNLSALLNLMPNCHFVATTGEKAADVVAQLTDSQPPKMGCGVDVDFCGHQLSVWRMPSTSRAYPLAMSKKAEIYARLFDAAGLL